MKKKIYKFLRLLVFNLFFFFILIQILDLSLSLVVKESLLFKPNSKSLFKTSEFNVYASTNFFGFRGDEKKIEKKQVVVIGDSLVFGFGSADNETFTHLLQEKIQSLGIFGYSFIYNLGIPGTHTAQHIKLAEKYLNEFEPKILIISIHLAGDIQDALNFFDDKKKKTLRQKIRIKNLFPNIYKQYNLLIKKNSENSDIDVLKYYRDAGEKFLSYNLNYDNELKELIKIGEINPNLLHIAKEYPDRANSFWEDFGKLSEIKKNYLEDLVKRFVALNIKIEKNGGKLLILPIPDANFVRSDATEVYKRYGFKVTENNLSSRVSEDILINIFENKNKINVIGTLDKLRSVDQEIYFKYDGHLNYNGNKILSKIILDYFIENKIFIN